MPDFDSPPVEVGRQIIVFLGHPKQHPLGLSVRDRTGQPARALSLLPVNSRLLHHMINTEPDFFAQACGVFFASFLLEQF